MDPSGRRQGAVTSGGGDFIDGGNGVAGTNLARINRVIVEIRAIEQSRFIADQAIFCDLGRVELDLDLHVAGNGHERRPK